MGAWCLVLGANFISRTTAGASRSAARPVWAWKADPSGASAAGGAPQAPLDPAAARSAESSAEAEWETAPGGRDPHHPQGAPSTAAGEHATFLERKSPDESAAAGAARSANDDGAAARGTGPSKTGPNRTPAPSYKRIRA